MKKSLRFEVFKRDCFTCQYCGRKAPDVVLHVDHIHPVSAGGKDELLNLVTSCLECNLGKGARLLSDSSAVEKQRAQLEELQERREQLDMMLEWRRSLADLDAAAVESLAEEWKSRAQGWHLNEKGTEGLRKLVKRAGVAIVMDAIIEATDRYIEVVDGQATQASVNKAWDYVGRIAVAKKASEGRPWMQDLYYIRGIVKNRFGYYDADKAKEILEAAFMRGATAQQLMQIAKSARNWSTWRSETEAL